MDNKLLCTEGQARIAGENQGFPHKRYIRVGSILICTAEGETSEIAEANAERIVTAWNCHDQLVKQLSLMTYLVRLKYGNLDKDVYAQIEESENLIDSLKHKP